jgi:alcohol dehydrogenase class IV
MWWGKDHDLLHDLILAQCVGVVLDYNRPVIADKLAQIEGMVEQLRAEKEDLFERLRVGRVSLSEMDFAFLAESAATNVNANTNPRSA